MDMDHGRALLKAIRYFGSQKALGGVINVSQQRINYWINSGKKISYEYVLKIEALTNGYVTRYELAPDKEEINKIIDKLVENKLNNILKNSDKDLSEKFKNSTINQFEIKSNKTQIDQLKIENNTYHEASL